MFSVGTYKCKTHSEVALRVWATNSSSIGEHEGELHVRREVIRAVVQGSDPEVGQGGHILKEDAGSERNKRPELSPLTIGRVVLAELDNLLTVGNSQESFSVKLNVTAGVLL